MAQIFLSLFFLIALKKRGLARKKLSFAQQLHKFNLWCKITVEYADMLDSILCLNIKQKYLKTILHI